MSVYFLVRLRQSENMNKLREIGLFRVIMKNKAFMRSLVFPYICPRLHRLMFIDGENDSSSNLKEIPILPAKGFIQFRSSGHESGHGTANASK